MPTGIYPRHKTLYVCVQCSKQLSRKRKSGLCRQCSVIKLINDPDNKKKRKANYKGMTGRHHSIRTKFKMSLAQRLERGARWKGDSVGYGSLHDWLRKYFGKSNKCENINCSKISKTFDWALVRGMKYERKRENFIMLCRKCHIYYDKEKLV